jgi:hypothetical protein
MDVENLGGLANDTRGINRFSISMGRWHFAICCRAYGPSIRRPTANAHQLAPQSCCYCWLFTLDQVQCLLILSIHTLFKVHRSNQLGFQTDYYITMFMPLPVNICRENLYEADTDHARSSLSTADPQICNVQVPWSMMIVIKIQNQNQICLLAGTAATSELLSLAPYFGQL